MLAFIKETQDVWQRLQTSVRPIVLYGMGNGADKIIDWCEAHNVSLAAFLPVMSSFAGRCFEAIRLKLTPQLKNG